MDNSNSVEGTMETVETVIFRAISEIRGKSKRPDEARIYNFVNYFLDKELSDSGVSDSSFWERMKPLEDQGYVINRPTKCGSSPFFLSKSLHEPSDNNSNTINTGIFPSILYHRITMVKTQSLIEFLKSIL